jgi:hypothetical protein
LDEDLLSFDVCFGDVTEIGLEGVHDEVLDASSAIVNGDEVDDLVMVFSILIRNVGGEFLLGCFSLPSSFDNDDGLVFRLTHFGCACFWGSQ